MPLLSRLTSHKWQSGHVITTHSTFYYSRTNLIIASRQTVVLYPARNSSFSIICICSEFYSLFCWCWNVPRKDQRAFHMDIDCYWRRCTYVNTGKADVRWCSWQWTLCDAAWGRWIFGRHISLFGRQFASRSRSSYQICICYWTEVVTRWQCWVCSSDTAESSL